MTMSLGNIVWLRYVNVTFGHEKHNVFVLHQNGCKYENKGKINFIQITLTLYPILPFYILSYVTVIFYLP